LAGVIAEYRLASVVHQLTPKYFKHLPEIYRLIIQFAKMASAKFNRPFKV
jgi:hypothetical protein